MFNFLYNNSKKNKWKHYFFRFFSQPPIKSSFPDISFKLKTIPSNTTSTYFFPTFNNPPEPVSDDYLHELPHHLGLQADTSRASESVKFITSFSGALVIRQMAGLSVCLTDDEKVDCAVRVKNTRVWNARWAKNDKKGCNKLKENVMAKERIFEISIFNVVSKWWVRFIFIFLRYEVVEFPNNRKRDAVDILSEWVNNFCRWKRCKKVD